MLDPAQPVSVTVVGQAGQEGLLHLYFFYQNFKMCGQIPHYIGSLLNQLLKAYLQTAPSLQKMDLEGW